METQNSSPLVSVVLPVHNEAQWLEKSVLSLLSQTYDHVEVLIVNDGSEDSSMKVAQRLRTEYPDKVRVFGFDTTHGEGAVRNIGLKHAAGEFVIETDADAIFPEKFIEDTLRYMREAGTECASLGELRVHPARTGPLSDYWRAKRKVSFIERKAGKKAAVVGIFCFSKKLADAIGEYDERVPSGTDFDFAKRAQNAGFIPVWAETVFFYHADETNLARFCKRLYNGSRLNMPVQKRWGMWLSRKQQVFELAHAAFATALILTTIATFRFYTLTSLTCLASLITVDGCIVSLLPKETRSIAVILRKSNAWLAWFLLPGITFLRTRASNYGKVSAILFPTATARKTTFDV